MKGIATASGCRAVAMPFIAASAGNALANGLFHQPLRAHPH
jgi:hypothetical protein